MEANITSADKESERVGVVLQYECMIHLYGGMSADQRRRVDSENSTIWKRVLDLVFRSRPVRWNVR